MVITPIFELKEKAISLKENAIKKLRRLKIISGLVIFLLSLLMILFEILTLKNAIGDKKLITLAALTWALRVITVLYAFGLLLFSGPIKNKNIKHFLSGLLILLKIFNIAAIFGWGSMNYILRGLISLIPVAISCYVLAINIILSKMTNYFKKYILELKNKVIR